MTLPREYTHRGRAAFWRRRARVTMRAVIAAVREGDRAALRTYTRWVPHEAEEAWVRSGRLYAEALGHLDRREECLRRARGLR